MKQIAIHRNEFFNKLLHYYHIYLFNQWIFVLFTDDYAASMKIIQCGVSINWWLFMILLGANKFPYETSYHIAMGMVEVSWTIMDDGHEYDWVMIPNS